MTDLAKPGNFLGINILRSNGIIFLSQLFIVSEKLSGSKKHLKVNRKVAQAQINETFRGLVEWLTYVMLRTTSDRSDVLNFYRTYQHVEIRTLWIGLKRLLWHLKGSLNIGLLHKRGKQESLVCYSDTD